MMSEDMKADKAAMQDAIGVTIILLSLDVISAQDHAALRQALRRLHTHRVMFHDAPTLETAGTPSCLYLPEFGVSVSLTELSYGFVTTFCNHIAEERCLSDAFQTLLAEYNAAKP